MTTVTWLEGCSRLRRRLKGLKLLLVLQTADMRLVLFQHLTGEYLTPFPHGLLTYPVNQTHELEVFELWPAMNLCPERVWQNPQEHRQRGRWSNIIAVFDPKVYPLVELGVKVPHVLDLLKEVELGTTCQHDKFI